MINENICNFSYGRYKFVLFAKHTNKQFFCSLLLFPLLLLLTRMLGMWRIFLSWFAIVLSFIAGISSVQNVMFFRLAVAHTTFYKHTINANEKSPNKC